MAFGLPIPLYVLVLAASLAFFALLARMLQTRPLVKSGFSIASGVLGFLVVAAFLGAMVVSAVALRSVSQEFLSDTIEYTCTLTGDPGILPNETDNLVNRLESVASAGQRAADALHSRLDDRLSGVYLMTGYLLVNVTENEIGMMTLAYAVLYAGDEIPEGKALIVGSAKPTPDIEVLNDTLRSLGYSVEIVDPESVEEAGLDRAMAEFVSSLVFPEGSEYWSTPLMKLTERVIEEYKQEREPLPQQSEAVTVSVAGATPRVIVEPMIGSTIGTLALLPGKPDPAIIEYLRGLEAPNSTIVAAPVALIVIDYNPEAYLNPASPMATFRVLNELKSESMDTVWRATKAQGLLVCTETAASTRQSEIISRLYDSITAGSFIVLLVLVVAALLAADPLAYNAVAATASVIGLTRLRGVTHKRLRLSLLAVTAAAALVGGSAGTALVQLVPRILGAPAPSMDKFTWSVAAGSLALYTVLLWWRASKALSKLSLEAAARGHPLAAEVMHENKPPGKLAIASLILGLYHALRGLLGFPFIFQYFDEHGPPENMFLAIILGIAGFIEIFTFPLAPILVAYGFARLLTWASPNILSRVSRLGGASEMASIASGLARWVAPRARALVVLAVFASVILASSGVALHVTYTGLETAVLGSIGGEVVGYKVLEPVEEINLTSGYITVQILGYDLGEARTLASRAAEACPGSLIALIADMNLVGRDVPPDILASKDVYVSMWNDYAYIVLEPSERVLEKLEGYAGVGLEEAIKSRGRAAIGGWEYWGLDYIRYIIVSAKPELSGGRLKAVWTPIELAVKIKGGLPGTPLAMSIYKALGYEFPGPGIQWVVTGEWVLDEIPDGIYYVPSSSPPPMLMVMADRGCEEQLRSLGLDLVVLGDSEFKGYIDRVGTMLELVNLSYYLKIAALTLLAMVALASAIAAYGASDVLTEILALVRLRGAGPTLALKVTAVLWGVIAGLSIAAGLLTGIGAGAAMTTPGGGSEGMATLAPVDLVFDRELLKLDEGFTVKVQWSLAQLKLGITPGTIALALLLLIVILVPPFLVGVKVFRGEAYKSIGRR